jgi:hypothetical protein
MKRIFPLLTLLALATFFTAYAQPEKQVPQAGLKIDPASKFIFYSVLEGLYEDGLTNADVDQILMEKEGQTYFHFILSCPVCTTTIWALESYRGRPKQLYCIKQPASTFGPGLSRELHDQLYSDKPSERLTAINSLVKKWMDQRITRMNLPEKERASLLDELGKLRKQGMDALESFRKKQHGDKLGVAEAAPAYVDLQECAVCNAAVGKPMKLPE